MKCLCLCYHYRLCNLQQLFCLSEIIKTRCDVSTTGCVFTDIAVKLSAWPFLLVNTSTVLYKKEESQKTKKKKTQQKEKKSNWDGSHQTTDISDKVKRHRLRPEDRHNNRSADVPGLRTRVSQQFGIHQLLAQSTQNRGSDNTGSIMMKLKNLHGPFHNSCFCHFNLMDCNFFESVCIPLSTISYKHPYLLI